MYLLPNLMIHRVQCEYFFISDFLLRYVFISIFKLCWVFVAGWGAFLQWAAATPVVLSWASHLQRTLSGCTAWPLGVCRLSHRETSGSGNSQLLEQMESLACGIFQEQDQICMSLHCWVDSSPQTTREYLYLFIYFLTLL